MPRYRVILAYDGTKFHGFQSQPNLRTVQGTIEAALLKMTKETPVTVFGAGRTDAGVHARGQVVHFNFPGNIPPRNMLLGLNSMMPLDVVIKDVAIVPETFHAQFSTVGKRYGYRVSRTRFTDPFKRFYTGHYPYQLDLGRIETAIQDVVGTHDFTSFAASGGVIKNKVRTIYTARMVDHPDEDEIYFEFIGNGFLYNMVRILVGVLLEIGNDRRPVDEFPRLYAVKDRQEARITAPASGLYLQEVYYDEAALQQAVAVRQ